MSIADDSLDRRMKMAPPPLIIIDMQVGMTWPSSGVRNNPGAEKNIQRLLEHWRTQHAHIIHVHHRSRTVGSPFYPGQPGIEVQAPFKPTDSEYVIEKSVPDAFANSGLAEWLHTRQIVSVVIVGVSTNNSIESTARTAANLGFKTFVISDACFAFAKADYDGVHRTAQEVHAMSLANLDGEYATILSCNNAIGSIFSGA